MTRIGPYQILGELGRGGMGVVYRAHQPSLGRDVALKLLNPDILHEEAVLRFLREMRVGAALNHPNLVTLLDGGAADGQHYLVMELIEGESLEGRLKRPLPLRQAIAIGAGLADAVAYLHQHKVIHRDIKPANVLLADGVAKLNDFGLAKSDSATLLTRTGGVLGTVAYLSPEAMQGSLVSEAGDIWSLGTVLHQMVVGSSPFPRREGADLAAWMQVVMTQPAPDPASRAPGIPAPLADVLRRALSKDPAGRPDAATVARILHDLADGERGHPPSLRPRSLRPSKLTPAPAPARPNRAVVVGAALLVLLGAVWIGTRERPVPTFHDDIFARSDRHGFARTMEWARSQAHSGKDPLALVQLAIMESLADRCADGVDHFRRAASLEPAWIAEFARGSVADIEDRPLDAQQHFARAMKLEPRSVDARARWLSVAQSRVTTQQFQAEQRILQELAPVSPYALSMSFGWRQNHGDLAGYQAELKRLQNLLPGSSTVGNMAGREAERCGDLPAAERYFRRRAEMDPTDVNAAVTLAGFIGRHRDLPTAIAAWRHCLATVGDPPFGRLELGVLLAKAGRQDEARKLVLEREYWSRLGPGQMVNFAQVLDAVSRSADALEILMQAQQRYPQYHLPFAAAAQRLLKSGFNSKIEGMFRQAMAAANGPLRDEYSKCLGSLLYQAGREVEALGLMSAGMANSADPSPLALQIANGLVRLKHEAEAIAILRRAAGRKPDAGVLVTLAKILLARRDGPGAEEALRQRFVLEGVRASDHLMLARALQLQKRWDDALEEAQKAQQLDPKELLARWVQFEVLKASQRWTEAGKVMAGLIELQPDRVEPWIEQAAVLEKLKDIPAAEAVLRAGLLRHSEFSPMREMLANHLTKLERMEEALVEWQWLHSRQPTRSDLLMAVFALQRKLGQVDEACRTARKFYRLNPPKIDNYLAALESLVPKGLKPELYVVELRQACSAVPKSVKPRLMLSSYLMRHGAEEQAIPLLFEIVQIEPKKADATVQLIGLLHDRGRSAEAADLIERLLTLPTATEGMLLAAGRMTTKDAHFDLAERCYRRALTLAPGSEQARRRLREVRLLQGKIE